MAKISASDVDWKSVALRLVNFRRMMNFTLEEFAQKLGMASTKLMSYEHGFKRKSFGDIIRICERCRLDVKWMLLGKGRPFKVGCKEYIDPLKADKGAGKRRSDMRKDAEDGIMNEDMLEFIMTVDEFKRKNNKGFPSMSEVYQLMLYLGYRKVEDRAPHFDCV